MVRFVTTPDNMNDPNAVFAHRDQHLVLLELADGAQALVTATENFINWGTVEGLSALPLGDWLQMSLHGTVFDADVDDVLFDDEYPGIEVTARMWGLLLANGLVIPNHPTSKSKILALIMAARTRAGEAARRIGRADLVPTQARPIDQRQVNYNAALAANANLQQGQAQVALPVLPDTTFWHLAPHLRYGDLIRSADRSSATVLWLEYVLQQRVRTVHREENSEGNRAWCAIIRACDELSNGDIAAMDDEESAAAIAEALLAAQLPSAFVTADPRPVNRRRTAAKIIKLRGQPDVALVTEGLTGALESGDFDWTAAFLAGETVPAVQRSLIESLAAALKINTVAFGEGMLKAVERALLQREARPEGASPQARIANLEDSILRRALAHETAPRAESADTPGGIAAPLASHTKAQGEELFKLYQTANFREQEAAILRMDDVNGCLHVALTGSFLGGVGEPDGPIDLQEQARAAHWTPIAVFHQLIWGKVASLQGKEPLRKLATHRIHMPRLLAHLATAQLDGVDAAGQERLASLKLDALWSNMQLRRWKGKLDLVHDILVPVLCAYHEMPLGEQPRIPSPECYDPMILRQLAPLLTGVMRVCAVSPTSQYTVRGMLAPAERLLALHGAAASPSQITVLLRAVAEYIDDTMDDFNITFNLARLEADASATLPVPLYSPEALGRLNLVLRAFNNTASRKRAAEGDSIEGYRLLRLPRTIYGAFTELGGLAATASLATVPPSNQRLTAAPPKNDPPDASGSQTVRVFHDDADARSAARRTACVRVGDKVDGIAPTGEHWSSSKYHMYDIGQARKWLAQQKCSNKCVKVLLMSGITDGSRHKRCKEHCEQPASFGSGLHVGTGADGRHCHSLDCKGARFNPKSFLVPSPDAE